MPQPKRLLLGRTPRKQFRGCDSGTKTGPRHKDVQAGEGWAPRTNQQTPPEPRATTPQHEAVDYPVTVQIILLEAAEVQMNPWQV